MTENCVCVCVCVLADSRPGDAVLPDLWRDQVRADGRRRDSAHQVSCRMRVCVRTKCVTTPCRVLWKPCQYWWGNLGGAGLRSWSSPTRSRCRLPCSTTGPCLATGPLSKRDHIRVCLIVCVCVATVHPCVAGWSSGLITARTPSSSPRAKPRRWRRGRWMRP